MPGWARHVAGGLTESKGGPSWTMREVREFAGQRRGTGSQVEGATEWRTLPLREAKGAAGQAAGVQGGWETRLLSHVLP